MKADDLLHSSVKQEPNDDDASYHGSRRGTNSRNIKKEWEIIDEPVLDTDDLPGIFQYEIFVEYD